MLLNEHDYVSEIVKTSWHRTLRLSFIPGLPPAQLRQAAEAIRAEVNAAGLLSEWNGDRFVAVDVPPNTEPARLFAIMEAAVDAGHAYCEWADVTPFVGA